MDVMTVIGTAIYSTLSADADIAAKVGNRIWQKVAPGGTPEPYILFQWMGGGELNSTTHETFDISYLVAAVSETQTEARQIAGYISAALKNKEVSYPDGYETWSVVTERDPYMDMSNVQNRLYWLAGAIYRFRGIK